MGSQTGGLGLNGGVCKAQHTACAACTLRTLGRWVERHIVPKQPQVFVAALVSF